MHRLCFSLRQQQFKTKRQGVMPGGIADYLIKRPKLHKRNH